MEEYSAWVRYGGHRLSAGGDLLYSDGTQNSDGGPKPVPAGQPWLDIDGDGTLSDDERDVDGDGLTNFDESGHGPMTFGWWKEVWDKELPYGVEYPGVDWLDGDSDGDGIADGADDQDHDDFDNVQETVGARTRGVNDLLQPELYGLRTNDWWIQPYNPCLPNPRSRTCSKHPPTPNKSWPPYDDKTPRPFPSLPYGGDSDPALHWPIDWGVGP